MNRTKRTYICVAALTLAAVALALFLILRPPAADGAGVPANAVVESPLPTAAPTPTPTEEPPAITPPAASGQAASGSVLLDPTTPSTDADLEQPLPPE